MRTTLLLCIAAGFGATVIAQPLQPGFNSREYLSMLEIAFQHYDSAAAGPGVPAPENYKVVYRSPEVGLKNRWNMWYRNDRQLAVISIRGTINQLPSWLENFYAAMTPATGTLQLNDSTRFPYQLAEDPKAMVHAGWLVGLASIAPSIVSQVKAAYREGIHEFIIVGHSQGGALAFMVRSYLHYLAQKGELPSGITYKTYCSAAPKPGNAYYAYDFDFITRNGWAFTVVNAADWVPETPFSVQRLTDFNTVNLFTNTAHGLKKQSFFARLVLKHVYNKISRRTRKTQQVFSHYFGARAYKQVRKSLPQLRAPVYTGGNNYQRAGVPVVLQPNAAYRAQFPDDPNKIFIHHSFFAYQALVKQWYGE